MIQLRNCWFITGFFLLFTSCGNTNAKPTGATSKPKNMSTINSTNTDTITLGGGCFWCIEAVLLELKGVISVTSGYAGGSIKNPTYKEVCTGTTGHAEVVQVTYNNTEVSLPEILEVFFTVHDPTTLNRQGNDVGTQYRSVIFYHNENQEKISKDIVARLDSSGAYPSKIVTEVSPLTIFYKAEDYHQNYYNTNPEQGYCRYVIQPKLEKFRKVFPQKSR